MNFKNICDLDDCLADYTRLELLTDCICRRCSLEATYEKYSQDGHPETSTSPSNPSSPIANSPIRESAKGETKSSISKSKKKRAQEARKLAGRVKALLDEGRVEEDVKGVQVVKVTKASTKQAMVARVCYCLPYSTISFHFIPIAASPISPPPQPITALRWAVRRCQEHLQG